jgi:hypothetical protein
MFYDVYPKLLKMRNTRSAATFRIQTAMLAISPSSTSHDALVQQGIPDGESEITSLLCDARLPRHALVFSRRAAFHRPGEETVVTLQCPVGHVITYSARELREAISNTSFNDEAVVPCLCKQCAYPGQLRVRPRRATIYHRLELLRGMYPRVVHLGGFDIGEEAPERYTCGEAFADGTPHPTFAISYNKLLKAGIDKHHCHVCALRVSQLLEPVDLTIDLVAARMQFLADLIDARCLATKKRRRVIATSVQIADRRPGPLTYAATNFVFSCHQPEHASVVSTVEQYFRPTKGGYCRACLQESGLASTKEIIAPPTVVGGRRRSKAVVKKATPAD